MTSYVSFLICFEIARTFCKNVWSKSERLEDPRGLRKGGILSKLGEARRFKVLARIDREYAGTGPPDRCRKLG